MQPNSTTQHTTAQFTIPPTTMVRARLSKLTPEEVKALAIDSGVPFGTLQKIRCGVTTNPGIETVRLFWPLLPQGGQ